MTRLADTILKLSLDLAAMTAQRRLLQAAERPHDAQHAVLQRILHANRDTAFGRAHGFARLRSVADYRAAVPVQSYESLRHLIARQSQAGSAELTVARPVFYARTSGSTGRAKDLPITAQDWRQREEVQRLTALALHRQTGFFAGKVMSLGSPTVEGRMPCGTPFGAAGGETFGFGRPITASKSVLPREAFAVRDYEAKYYVYALLGIAEPDITGLVAANPSTILKLLEIVDRHADKLLQDLRDRSLWVRRRVPAELGDMVLEHLGWGRERAEQLGKALDRRGHLRGEDIWPRLDAIVTWTGASCGVALHELRRQLAMRTRTVELGYRASEFTGTLTVDARHNLGLPTLEHNFFEFVEQADWEDGRGQFLTLAELETGRNYYVFATTVSGLYRYDINDLVTVNGRFGNCPTLAFVQKGRGVTNITGEKLYEAQAIEAVSRALLARGMSVPCFALLADEERRGYDLLIEQDGDPAALSLDLARDIDRNLRRLNLEYDNKRASGRLGELRLVRLRYGAGEILKRKAMAEGRREAQYKPLCHGYWRDWPVDLACLDAGAAAS